MLDAFKIKPFDLEPVYASWPDAPRFHGKPKKDPSVGEWLAQIKAGCIERKVPREYWHKVAQHYLANKALARFEEVKVVMRHMHGGKYRWTWKTFKVAMRNMGWDIDAAETESVEVQSKPSGLWWIIGRRRDAADKESAPIPAPPPVPPKGPQKSKTMWEVSTLKSFPMPNLKRSTTVNSVETISSTTSASSSSKSSTPKSTPASTALTTPVTTPDSTPGETMTTITHAPIWLLNACQSLDYLTSEHPKVMTALSAVLITVGSLPALPVISAGAGGAFLASGTAHAIGSIAVGLGTWLKAQNEGQAQITAPPAAMH